MIAKDITIADAQKKAISGEYDLLISCLGYEQRATAVPKLFSQYNIEYKLSIAFPVSELHDYAENSAWYLANATNVVVHPDSNDIADLVVGSFSECNSTQKNTIRALIDISCFSSDRIAAIVEGVHRFIYHEKTAVQIDFFYSLAKFNPPYEEFIPNKKIGPISPFFSGWKNNNSMDQVAIIGLGYEIDKARGVHEYLEPKSAWLFVPTSSEEEYLKAVLEINKGLTDACEEDHITYYKVHSPLETFANLSALVRSLSQTSAPIIIPFGPKIFVLAALLVGLQHFDIPIWRVSGRDMDKPANRIAEGTHVGLSIHFEVSVLAD